jgi:hypothetical protein
VYLEDKEVIALTTDIVKTTKDQTSAKCQNEVCSRWTADEMITTEVHRKNTLQVAIEFLFMCGRDQRICPLKRGKVHRMDLRPQLVVKRADGSLVQMIDDRTFNIKPHTFTHCMRLFVSHRNPQHIWRRTKLSFGLIKRVCEILDEFRASTPYMYRILSDWWMKMVRNEYPPWRRVSKAFSEEYNDAWVHFDGQPTRRRDLLHLITTNALMDLTCIARMVQNNCLSPATYSVVYVGCAHAECISDFFLQFGPCDQAIENEFKLKPVQKQVSFGDGKLSKTFLPKSTIRM